MKSYNHPIIISRKGSGLLKALTVQSYPLLVHRLQYHWVSGHYILCSSGGPGRQGEVNKEKYYFSCSCLVPHGLTQIYTNSLAGIDLLCRRGHGMRDLMGDLASSATKLHPQSSSIMVCSLSQCASAITIKSMVGPSRSCPSSSTLQTGREASSMVFHAVHWQPLGCAKAYYVDKVGLLVRICGRIKI